MKLLKKQISVSYFIQVLLYLFVNIFFILKYFPRAGADSPVILILYIILLFAGIFMFNIFSRKISEHSYKIAFWTILILMISFIIVLLIIIDPYAVRVDRWSAVTFFWDGLFNGNYPYGVHTHVSENNFPSPFPIWHFINIPFYLLGEVGIGLIFFLILSAITTQYFFSSYRKSFLFLFLLFISPAYWWEAAVRSDSLSNAFLIYSFILWWFKKGKTIEHNFLLAIIACGLLASTRLSAIIPIALFLFKPYLKLDWKRKIVFPIGVLIVIALTFFPFIFWDTTEWVFFTRNPFMSQSSVGSPMLLLFMILSGILFALRWKRSEERRVGEECR